MEKASALLFPILKILYSLANDSEASLPEDNRSFYIVGVSKERKLSEK